jgi:hypothetical protein
MPADDAEKQNIMAVKEDMLRSPARTRHQEEGWTIGSE